MDDKQPVTIDDLINTIPLTQDTNNIVQNIINENDINKLKEFTNLFNLNQAKKNALRVLKLNSLLDKVSDEMIRRFQKQPGEFSNSDLLNYLTVAQNAIDRANKSLALIDETPAIQLNQVNVNIQSNEKILDRESRKKVTDAVAAILEKINNISNENVIEIDENIENPIENNGNVTEVVQPLLNEDNEEDK